MVDTGDTVMTRTWSWHPGSGLRDEISTGRVGKDNSRREDRVSKDMEVKKMSELCRATQSHLWPERSCRVVEDEFRKGVWGHI